MNTSNSKQIPKPTIIHPNNLPKGESSVKKRTEAIRNILKPESSRPANIYRSYFKVREGFKGAGVTSSRPLMQSYPPLPESPTNRPLLLTNIESTMPVKKGSNEYKKRENRLVKQFQNARQQTLKNWIFGKPVPQQPDLNSEGYPKSFFTVSNRGFKPRPVSKS